jgi:Mrp family chromosome partitioning ATPase
MTTNEAEISGADLREHLAAMRSRLPLILACALIAAALIAVIDLRRPDEWSARATARVITPGRSVLTPDETQVLAQTMLAIASTPEIATAAASSAKIPVVPGERVTAVKAKGGPNEVLIAFEARWDDEDTAIQLSDAAVRALQARVQGDNEAETGRLLAPIDAALKEARARLDSTTISDPARSERERQVSDLLNQRSDVLRRVVPEVVAVSGATNNTTRITAPVVRDAVLVFLIVGLLVGEAVVVARSLRGSIPLANTSGALTRLTGAPAVTLDVARRGRVKRGEITRLAPFIRSMCDEPVVTIAQWGRYPSARVVTEVATTPTYAFPRTVLVDADVRHPHLDRLLGFRRTPGLADVVLRDLPVERAGQLASELPTPLVFLAAGEAGEDRVPELLGRKGLGSVIERAGAWNARVIVSITAVSPLDDLLALVNQTDASVLLAIDVNSTTQDEVRQLADAIRGAGGTLLGVVAERGGSRRNSDRSVRPWNRVEATPLPTRSDAAVA